LENKNKFIGGRIKAAREQAGVTQEELSKYLGRTRSSLAHIEIGTVGADINDLGKIAMYFNKPLDWFLHDNIRSQERPLEAIMAEANAAMKRLPRILPVKGTVPCGYFNFEEENIRGYTLIDRLLLGAAANKEDLYVLDVSGESLAGDGIHPGDQLVVEPNPDFVDGKIYVVRIDNECTAKHVFWANGTIKLTPSNPDYSEMIVDKEKVSILGRVILSGKWKVQ
jgi:SOS-response transcriptional repressor LexA